MEKATGGELAHCGFMLAGTEDLYHDALRGMASYRRLYERLKPQWASAGMTDFRQPLLRLAGFDRLKLHEVALKVREAHGIAYQWNAIESLTDDMLTPLFEQAAAHFRDKLTTVPRGVLKVLVDILDELQRSAPSSAAEVLAAGIDPERVEAIERQATHLTDRI